MIHLAAEMTGTFRELSPEMYQVIEEITRRGNDAEIKKRKDGTYDVFELERRKRKPRVITNETI